MQQQTTISSYDGKESMILADNTAPSAPTT